MATPRSQGLLIEAMALQAACSSTESDADLLTRANTLYSNVTAAAQSAGSTWRLYVPSFFGGYQSEADAIASEYKTRHGVNPLDVDAPPPTGDLAQLGQLASGNVFDAVSAGSDVVASDVNAAIPNLPTVAQAASVVKYLAALVALLLIFFVWEEVRA